MTSWQYRPVLFRYQLSDWTFFTASLPLQVRQVSLLDQTTPCETITLPDDELIEASEGFMIRGLSVARELPTFSKVDGFICYAASQYQHFYIDLSISFEDYKKQFSSKTRSTLIRKVKKYAKYSGGSISWKTYSKPEELREFFHFARSVSSLTYQEKLFDGGIPDSESFFLDAKSLAAENRLRAYVLFDGEKPISYLYCPVHDGVLIYAYLGYDPDYMKMSVGTVLQWLALEQLFNEASFRYFNFTEGQSAHKRLFSTHQKQCANVCLVKKSVKNYFIVYCHYLVNRMSGLLGEFLERLGLKAKIGRFLRFG